MPIYQYDCAGCQRRVDLFFRTVAAAAEAKRPACPECGSRRLRRVVSRFARARSEGERVESIDLDQEMGRLESGDVGGFSRWARRMGEQYDSELGSDFRQLADRADAGEDPVERFDAAHTLRHRIEKKREELSSSSEADA